MTVSITDRKITYAGNGITTIFSIPFPFQSINGDIVVVHIDSGGVETVLTLDVNYSISGSNLTYPISGSPLPTGESLFIYRNTPLTQTANVDGQPTNFLLPIENALDRLQFQMQQMQEQVDRCVKTDITDATSPPSVTDYESALSIVQALQTAFENLVVYTHSEVSGVAQAVFTMPGAWPDLDVTSNVVVYDNGFKIDRSEYSVTDTDEITFDVGFPVGRTIIFELHQAISSDDLDSALSSIQRFNAIDNAFCLRASGVDYTLVKDVYDEGPVSGFEGMATGTAVSAGIFTRKTNSTLSRNGFSLHFSGVTLTGAGRIKLRYRIYSDEAKHFKNRNASFSCKVLHNVGSPVNYNLTINKADALDDFSSVTLISYTTPAAVASGANTRLKEEAINLGDCSNGIEIILEAEAGAVTTKNFEFAELNFEDRTISSDIPLNEKPVVLQEVLIQDGAFSFGTTVMPLDSTTPQKTEGDEYMTLDITPRHAASMLNIEVLAYHAVNANYMLVAALFKDTDSDALASGCNYNAAAEVIFPVMLHYRMIAGTTSKITFKYRAGPATAATARFNGNSVSQLNGTLFSHIKITEIKQ